MTSAGALVIEDRTLAGRCLCEIEDLMARRAPAEFTSELTQLHRSGLALRYGMEFSRRHVVELEKRARQLRRALEAFERSGKRV